MNSGINEQNNVSLQVVIRRILLLLTVFTLGGFVALIIVNRLLVAQLAVYGETYMAAASAIIDFMDDMLPFLAWYMVSFMGLAVATLAMWLFTKAPIHYRRYGVALVALVVVVMTVILIAGQSTPVTSVPMITPTPVF